MFSRSSVLSGILFLCLVTNICNAQSIEPKDKISITAKIFGLLYTYAGSDRDWDIQVNQRFLNLFDEWRQANTIESFNHYASKLIGANSSARISEKFSAGQAPYKAFQKVADDKEYPIVPDFAWINDSKLSEENKAALLTILASYKFHKKGNLKRKGKQILHVNRYGSLKSDSTAMFTLGMMQFWTRINYYFPYIKLMDQPWDQVLETEYQLFENMSTKADYYDNLLLLSAYLDDSHGFVSFDDYQKWSYGFGVWQTFPVEIWLLNGEILISNFADQPHLQSLYKGDTITHINGIPSRQVLEMNAKKIVASTSGDSLRQLERSILCPFNHPALGDTIATITVKGKDYTIHAEPIHYSQYPKFIRKKLPEGERAIEDVDKHTGYINLIHASGREIHKAFKSFHNKEYLLLDLRGYPKNSLILFLAKNLSRKAHPVGSYYYPVFKFPGYFRDYKKSLKYYVSNPVDLLLLAISPSKGKTMPTTRKPYPGKIAVLVNEYDISYAETVGMLIKSYRPDALFVGRPSEGANGDVTTFPLPYHVSVSISGLHWHYADGAQLQRKGLKIDHYVPRSIAEMMEPIDTIKREALNLIKTR